MRGAASLCPRYWGSSHALGVTKWQNRMAAAMPALQLRTMVGTSGADIRKSDQGWGQGCNTAEQNGRHCSRVGEESYGHLRDSCDVYSMGA